MLNLAETSAQLHRSSYSWGVARHDHGCGRYSMDIPTIELARVVPRFGGSYILGARSYNTSSGTVFLDIQRRGRLVRLLAQLLKCKKLNQNLNFLTLFLSL